jgi:hypothetical protein
VDTTRADDEAGVSWEQFKAGYIPNDDDIGNVTSGPVGEMLWASFDKTKEMWVADGKPDDFSVFILGAAWMKRFMEAADGTAMHVEDYAAEGEASFVEGLEEPPE